MGTSDEFSDWEELSNPYNTEPHSSQSNEFRLELKENFYSDELSIFPPSEHEGLPLLHAESKSSEEETLSVSSLSVAVSETDSPRQHQVEPDLKLWSGISKFGGRIRVLVNKLRFRSTNLRLGYVFIPGGAIVVVLLVCLKILQWKHRLLVLIREKDQRISQLLSQIAYMNDMLSARRKVPILRIN